MSMAKTQAMDNKWPRETASMPRPVGSTLQQLCLEQQNDILAQSPSCMFIVACVIQVEAKGLKPLTTYFYQFNVCASSNKSPVGRTKTAPAKDDAVSKLSFAVFSCSNFRE